MTNQPNYDDIINLPRPFSVQSKMSLSDRAAQFSPFAALTGYDATVQEAGRLVDQRIDLSEDAKSLLNERLQMILELAAEKSQISITHFQKDKKKDGGDYITTVGTIQKIDSYQRTVHLADQEPISIDDIISIESDVFPES